MGGWLDGMRVVNATSGGLGDNAIMRWRGVEWGGVEWGGRKEIRTGKGRDHAYQTDLKNRINCAVTASVFFNDSCRCSSDDEAWFETDTTVIHVLYNCDTYLSTYGNTEYGGGKFQQCGRERIMGITRRVCVGVEDVGKRSGRGVGAEGSLGRGDKGEERE